MTTSSSPREPLHVDSLQSAASKALTKARICLAWLASLSLFGLFIGILRSARCVRWRWIWSLLSVLDPAPRGLGLDFKWGGLAMEPSSAAERKRASDRVGLLPTRNRVALDLTRGRRKKLLRQFQSWLWQEKGISLLFLLREKPGP